MQGRPGTERITFATLSLAATVPPFVVSVVSIAQRASGAAPSPGTVAGVTLSAVAALLALALANRGPVLAVAMRFDPRWDGAWRRRPVVASLWALLAVVAVAQVVRLSLFMSDPALRWASTYPPVDEGVTHMCMSAYVHAGDLVRRGIGNPYAEEHYPAFLGGTLGHSQAMASPVKNLTVWLEDPYEYPPTFLLLPRLGLALTDDYLVLRTGWFALKLAIFGTALFVISRAVSAERGRVAALLVPLVVAALPVMFDLQFGQFHLVAVIAAMGGMLAFARGRDALGGLLLAIAIVTKIFPGLLLVYLLLQRKLRAVAWTAAASVGLAALALLVVGPASFHAFLTYQLPRIASGQAFAFFLRSDLTIAANWGVYGIPIKLGRLGVPHMTTGLATMVSWLYMLKSAIRSYAGGVFDRN